VNESAHIRHAETALAILKGAEQEGRDPTDAEKERVGYHLTQAETLRTAKEVGQLIGGGLGSVRQDGPMYIDSASFGGPGDIFVQSQGYKSIRDSSARPQQWTSGPVEVASSAPMLMKGTLLETGVGGPGGGPVPAYYQPGIVSKLLEPLGVADVFGSSQTSASQVRYINEGTATNAAAGVAEGGTKPESTLGMAEITEPIKKIATVCQSRTSS
jgi:hypothetical protein